MKRNMVIINLLAAFIWMSVYLYTPTLPAYAQTLGAGATAIGIISGAYGVMQIILRTPMGVIADRWGKDKLLFTIGFLFVIASSLIFVFGKSVEWLVLGRGVSGAAAAWWVVISSVYAKYNTPDKQIRAQGMLTFSSGAGKMVGALFCGIIAQAAGYASTFYASLAISIVGLICVLCMKDIRFESKAMETKASLKSAFQNIDLLKFSLLCCLLHIVGFSIPTVFAAVAAADVGASSMQIGLLIVVYCLAMSLASLFAGTKAYKKLGGIKTTAFAFLIGAVSCLPFFYTINVWFIFLMQILSGISFGITISVLSGMVIMCVPDEQRGLATGIFHSLAGLGVFLGPLVMGVMIDSISFVASFYTMCIINIAATFLCFLLIPQKYDRMT